MASWPSMVLGMDIGPSEAEPLWTGFLRTLRQRGLRVVKLVVSDAHEGLKAAVAKLLNATWQRWGEPCFRHIFGRTVRACIEAKIAKGEIVHIDATLIRADVSWESLAVRHVEAVGRENQAPLDECLVAERCWDQARWARWTAISARLVAIELVTWRSALAGTAARHEAFG